MQLRSYEDEITEVNDDFPEDYEWDEDDEDLDHDEPNDEEDEE